MHSFVCADGVRMILESKQRVCEMDLVDRVMRGKNCIMRGREEDRFVLGINTERLTDTRQAVGHVQLVHRHSQRSLNQHP